MARRKRPAKKTAPPRLDNAGQGAAQGSLRGGLGDPPADSGRLGGLVNQARQRQSAAAQAAGEAAKRYDVNLPSSVTTLRKQMKVKSDDRRRQLAGALLSAAYQHNRLPDEGSRLYGRAFQELTAAEQQGLLSVLTPEESSFVTQTFTDFVEQGTPDSTSEATTTGDRAKDAARKAFEEVTRGLKATEVVDVDEFTTPDAPDKPPLPKQPRDEVKYLDAPGPEWSKNQIKRGWRRVLIGSDGKSAPRSVMEVLLDRAGDFSDAPPAPAALVPNPNLGQTKTIYEVPRATRENTMEVSRLTPSAFEELSPESQAAATTGRELLDIFNQYADSSPGFEDTPEGRRILARIDKLVDEFPDAVEFMDNPGLETQTLPKNPDPVPEGRNALPQEMRIGWFIGEPASSAPHKWEDRPDRRSKYGIPADAPNRRGWLEVLTTTKKVNELVKEKQPDGSIKTVTKTVTKRVPRRQPELGPGVLGEVDTLPYSPEISRGGPERAARKDTELRGAGERRLPYLDEMPDNAPEAADGDVFASDAEIEAALAEAYSNDPNAAPVEDNTMTAEAWEQPKEGNTRVLLAGTAQGSPAQVKRDRDFALREGKSASEKLAEKLWRMASEWGGDVDAVSDSRTVGMIDRSGIDFDADGGEGFGQSAIAEATGMEPIRKRSTGGGGRRPLEVLPLDNLAPIWRAYVEDVNEYGKVTFRRPTAYEVAGFLVDRANVPDSGLAARLEPVVSASMAALEGTPASGKSARIAGKPYPASQARGKALWGANKPPYTQPAQKLIADWEAKQANPEMGGFVRGDEAPQEFIAGASGGEAPAAGTTQEPPADNPFRNFRAKAQKAASDPTNIATLLAVLAGVSGGEAQAQDELPVEYVAMARRKQMTAAQRKARNAQNAGGSQQQGGQQGGQQQGGQQQAGQQANQQGSQQGTQQVQQQAPQAPPSPKPGSLKASNTVRGLKAVSSLLGSNAGRLLDASVLATAVGGGIASAPYIGPPIERGWNYLTGGGTGSDEQDTPAANMTEDAINALYEGLEFAPEPGEGQASPQGLNDQTTSIPGLLRMLSNKPLV